MHNKQLVLSISETLNPKPENDELGTRAWQERKDETRVIIRIPKDPCTQIVYTLAPKYQYRDYFKA